MIEAGAKLGLSEEETIATASRSYRRQRRADDSLTKEDVARNIIQSANVILDPSTVDEAKYLDKTEESRAFGQMQDDLQTYRADDRGFTEDEETGLVRRETLTEQKPIEMGDFASVGTRRNKKTGKLFPVEREVEGPVGYEGANAPRSVLVDALTNLESEIERPKTSAIDRIARALGGSAVDLEAKTARDALREQLEPETVQDSRVGRAIVGQDRQMREQKAVENLRAIAIAQQEAGRPLSREQASQLLQELLPEGAKSFSDENVFRETQEIARTGFLTGGQSAMADEAIGRIGEIRSLGKTSEPAMVQQVMPADEAIRTQVTQRSDGIYLDDAGNPVAIQGPEIGPRPTGPQSVRQFIADNLYETQSSGTYPQVDVGQGTSNVVDKLNAYYAANNKQGAKKTDVRSVDELERLINSVQATRQRAGKANLMLDFSEGKPKQVQAGNNRVQGAMFELGMDKGEQIQLANAMYQMDAATRSSVNENPTGTYLSRMTKVGPAMVGENINREGAISTGASEAMLTDPGGVSFQTMKSGSRFKRPNTPVSGVDVKAAIRNLPVENLDSKSGVMALEPGTPNEAPYNRTRETDPRAVELSLIRAANTGKGYLLDPKNVENAQRIGARSAAAGKERADKMSEIISSLPPTARRSPMERRESRGRNTVEADILGILPRVRRGA